MSELNRLLNIVVDVENLFMLAHKEKDPDIKEMYLYLFKVHILNTITKLTLIPPKKIYSQKS